MLHVLDLLVFLLFFGAIYLLTEDEDHRFIILAAYTLIYIIVFVLLDYNWVNIIQNIIKSQILTL